MTTASQERAFYDEQYRQFLALPDHALAVNRAVMEKNLADPSHPFFERRLLYRATMAALEEEPLAGKHVLDYGCGPADFGIWMATENAEVTLLDLSPVAIALGLRRAAASGVTRRVRGIAADASKLDMFADRAFDVVFACASLHHTLKYPGALDELARVMKPSARLVLCETWGGNPLLNAARRLRAGFEGEKREQGEEILISRKELADLKAHFADIDVRPLNLFAMGKRLLRGRLNNSWARTLVASLEATDRIVLRALPFLGRYCGEAVITARRDSG